MAGHDHPDLPSKVRAISGRSAIDTGDDIAGPDPRLVRRAAGNRRIHDHTFGRLHAESAGKLRSHRLQMHANPAAHHMPLLFEAVEYKFRSRGWNVEGHPDGAA